MSGGAVSLFRTMAKPKTDDETDHRKPDADRRDGKIPVRVTPVERAMILAGARHASVEASTWMRLLAIQRCRDLGFTEDTVTVPTKAPEADRMVTKKEKAAPTPARKGKAPARPKG